MCLNFEFRHIAFLITVIYLTNTTVIYLTVLRIFRGTALLKEEEPETGSPFSGQSGKKGQRMQVLIVEARDLRAGSFTIRVLI